MDFTLHRNHSAYWTMDTPHLHDGCELLLSLTDGGSFFLMDSLHPLRRGTLLLMGDRILHRSVATQGAYDRYVLHVPVETLVRASTPQTDLRMIFAQNRCVQLDEADTRQLSALLERCLASSGAYGEDLLRECAFLQLLVSVGQLLARSSLCPVRSEGLSAPVRQAIDYIGSHLSEDLSLDRLSEHCFVTKYHLCHLFKSETGFSVGEYIQRLRVSKAAALLRGGESVQLAGEHVGFANCSNFIRVFTKLMGTSPGRYGKLQKQNQIL